MDQLDTSETADSAPSPRPLWAPWRIQYVTAPKAGGCFLCDKAQAGPAEDVANLILERGVACYVLLNAYPYNSGHLMVAPYRHVADLSDLTAAELAEIMSLTLKAKAVMVSCMHPDGFNFGFNLGKAAGAGVPGHVHGHLVPRWIGDTNFMPVVGDTRVVPQSLLDTAAYLRQAWK